MVEDEKKAILRRRRVRKIGEPRRAVKRRGGKPTEDGDLYGIISMYLSPVKAINLGTVLGFLRNDFHPSRIRSIDRFLPPSTLLEHMDFKCNSQNSEQGTHPHGLINSKFIYSVKVN